MTAINEVFDGQGNVIESEVILPTPSEIQTALKEYRDEQASTYVYRGVPMKLTAVSKDDLTTIYFAVLFDPTIPDETVMAAWQEDGYDTLYITAGDLRADGKDIIAHRQKAWSVYNQIKGQTFDTIEDAKSAFDAAMEA